jgi:hypothetical protein
MKRSSRIKDAVTLAVTVAGSMVSASLAFDHPPENQVTGLLGALAVVLVAGLALLCVAALRLPVADETRAGAVAAVVAVPVVGLWLSSPEWFALRVAVVVVVLVVVAVAVVAARR